MVAPSAARKVARLIEKTRPQVNADKLQCQSVALCLHTLSRQGEGRATIPSDLFNCDCPRLNCGIPVKVMVMTEPHVAKSTSKTGPLKRLLPLALLILALVAFFASGLQRMLNFDAIAVNYGLLASWVAAQPVFATLAAFGMYTIATTLSFPAAWILTVAIGLVFGWFWAALIVIAGATLGATLLFLAAKLAFADFFRARAGGWIKTMANGFREDAVAYMFFLRLAPVVPFALVNVVPAILGVPLRIFVFTTAIGIIPGVLAYSLAGEGLRSLVVTRAAACAQNVAPCGAPLTPGNLVTPQILIALGVLGLVSLMPVVLKRLRRKKT